MSVQPANKTLSDYRAAYKRVHGKDPEIHYYNGWYTVNGMATKFRESNILRMADALNSRADCSD